LAAAVVATAVMQVAVRGLIPGNPAPALLVLPPAIAVPAPLRLLALREVSPLGRGLPAAGLVFLGAVISLFPWGAGQLSQL